MSKKRSYRNSKNLINMLKKSFLCIMALCMLAGTAACTDKESGENIEPQTEISSLPKGKVKVTVDTDSMKKQAVAALNSLRSVALEPTLSIASSAEMVYVPNSANTNYNKAITERNRMFEKKYSTSLIQFSEDVDTMLDTAYLNLLAGIDYTDIFSVPQKDIGRFASKGILLKLTSIPDGDFISPYFDIAAMEQASYGHNNYALYGDFNKDIGNYYCLYVNRELLAAQGLEMPYKKVKDGSWTWAELSALVKASSNLGDAAAIASMDSAFLVKAGYKSSGGNLVDTGYTKTPAIGYTNSSAQNILQVLGELCNTARSVYDSTVESGSAAAEFMQGHSLFYIGTVKEMKTITTMPYDWCILPLPKGSVEQKNYYTYTSPEHAAILVYAGADTENMASTLKGLYAASTGGYLSAAYYYELIDTSIRDSYALDMMDYICGLKDGVPITDFVDIYGDGVPELHTYTEDALTSALSDPNLTAQAIADNVVGSFNSVITKHFMG